MSDIIPFPKMKNKLMKDIDEAVKQAQYERAYDIFNAYERHFELSPELALMKCEVLWQLEAYLELKEESNILMVQGFQPYDTLMVYYIKSLFALGHYHSVVEMITQVIDEVREHGTRLILLPIKDQAQSKLDERQDYMAHRLQNFTYLDQSEQTQLLLSLIDDSAYQFQSTIAYLLQNETLPMNIQSLMLEYLRFARYNQCVQVEKPFCNLKVKPSELSGIEQTTFKTELLPRIIHRLESEMPSFVHEAYVHLHTHNIALYPVDILERASIETWVEGYKNYFKALMGFEYETDGATTAIFNLIKSLNT
ncbi:hypothetical protein HR080_02950 [Staphylococcus schleiferi subsp. coagulans]|uniref:hypothetical protein n=1 Tax=Staphylococcus coagulans TaxID=74706 RepID=UPI0015FC6F1F|nr:hypothetical protein [Staphylococcus coagulans]MBA8778316.1 hypothetical protein [Staphylococcus coagulans]